MKTKIFLLCLKIIIIFIVMIKISGCSENSPVNPDGNAKIKLHVIWNTTGQESEIMKMANAKVILLSDYGTIVKYTDEDGVLIVDNLPSGSYNVSVTCNLPSDNKIILTGTIEQLFLKSGLENIDTIFVKPYSSDGIVINEIYFCGSVNDIFYCWDQYIELYNSTDSIKYLDGCIIARCVSTENFGAGADGDNDGDIEKVLHLSKFPGKPGGREYAFNPKSYLVLAMDGMDHSNYSQNALNLTKADWEFYNQYSTDDMNNESIKNLINMQPDYTKDFNMPLDIGVLIITNGQDSIWQDGIDVHTILDGIEYDNQTIKNKTLDSRIDKSQIVSPAKYSGKSLQRNEPGLDSNNGFLDWRVIDHPTPGYQ